jgi:hypothetical protein
MSATNSHPAAYPHAWLQPVRYDLDEYRLFVEALDGDLGDLVSTHAPRRVVSGDRGPKVDLQRDELVDLESPTPPEQSSH